MPGGTSTIPGNSEPGPTNSVVVEGVAHSISRFVPADASSSRVRTCFLPEEHTVSIRCGLSLAARVAVPSGSEREG